MPPKRILLAVLFAITLGLGFGAGFWMPRDDEFFALKKNFEIFGAVYEELVGGYVDPLNPEQMMRTGLEAMLEDLDPYTVFYDEADNADIDIITRGHYGGVGLNLGIRDDRITVSSPIEDASGYKQGVRAGDIITHIAGKPTAGLSLGDIDNLLRGEPGTTVEITVEREGEPEPLRFVLTREEVKLKNVPYSGFAGGDPASGIGYVKLERFAREAAPEVRQAIQALQAQGALRGLVLDLRDNPGGLLDAAVDITELFVPQGSVIVSTHGRTAEMERTYRSKQPPLLPETPVVVLVNGLSASASEIVAGALQDLDRGVIAGVPTFGKGLVQVIRPLPYNTSIKMTISKYYTPSGRCIQALDYGLHDGSSVQIPDSLRRAFRTAGGRTVRDGGGIEPDVTVTLGAENELEQALLRRAAFFFYANHYAASHPQLPPGFAVTDALLGDFRTWLGSQRFTYRTSAERALETLGEDLDAMGYADARDEVKALDEAIARGKAADFERHKDRLKEQLRAEIAARYLSQSEQVAASLKEDAQFERAVALLNDTKTYTSTLKKR